MSTPEAPTPAPAVPLTASSQPKQSSTFKKVLWSVVAGFTTPEAIKAEKILAIVALTRVAVLVPSAGLVVGFVVKALGG